MEENITKQEFEKNPSLHTMVNGMPQNEKEKKCKNACSKEKMEAFIIEMHCVGHFIVSMII
jgi:hypothetical protein